MMVMQTVSATGASAPRAPWHLWVVGVVALLWNASGAYTIMASQAGRFPNQSAVELAYYAAQPTWFAIAVDIALVTGIAASVALLLRNRAAAWLFAISLVAMVSTNAYDLAAGTSLVIGNTGAAVATGIIALLGILELAYATAMKKRGVLR